MQVEGRHSREIFNQKSKQLREKIQVYSQRYDDLERRRRLEREGYNTDIASLKKKLTDTENRLRQVGCYCKFLRFL